MLELERVLADRLKRLHVQVSAAEPEGLLLRRVPTNRRYYNKPHTNILVARPREGAPFLACVDEDLEYKGADVALTRAFAAAPRRQGWRVLYLGGDAGDAETAIGSALTVLGIDGEEPSLGSIAGGGLRPGGVLAAFATDASRSAREGTAEPCVGREDEIERLLAAAFQWRPRLPIVVGEPGVGKTNLLFGAAGRLAEWRPAAELRVVDIGVLFAGTLSGACRDNLLGSLLTEAAQPGRVVALEKSELALSEAPHGAFLLAGALDKGARLIATTLPDFFTSFEKAPLAGRVQAIGLAEPCLERVCQVLAALKERIARRHGVTIDEALLGPTVLVAGALAGRFAGKAVALLDAAASRCALAGASELDLYHVHLAAGTPSQDAGAGRGRLGQNGRPRP